MDIPPKFASRKFSIALLVLFAIVVLALAGKLDAVAGAALAAVLGLYDHANLKQKRDALQAQTQPEGGAT